MPRSPTYATVPCASGRRHAFAFHEAGPLEPTKPRLLDRVRAAARLRHYSRRTEATYVAWIRRYIFSHGKRHPAELGAAEVTRFSSSLAVDGRVAASTQNQAARAKDHVTVLPAVLKADLARHLEAVRTQHRRDLQQGAGWVELPTALARKYPDAGREWVWQWAFPATRPYRDRETGQWRPHHLHESVLQRVVKDAARRSGIAKHGAGTAGAS